jgi:hypothetical protein
MVELTALSVGATAFRERNSTRSSSEYSKQRLCETDTQAPAAERASSTPLVRAVRGPDLGRHRLRIAELEVEGRATHRSSCRPRKPVFRGRFLTSDRWAGAHAFPPSHHRRRS